MKILFLSRRFAPDIGGVEKHIYEISKVLMKQGHHITVITESPGVLENFEGIRIIRIPKNSDNWFKKFYIWKWVFLNKKYFKEANVVHAHDVYYWYLPLKLWFLSKKSFVTFHGYESYPISKRAILSRKVSELVANGNITVGDFIKKWYHTKSDYVIYGGVEIPKKNNRSINKLSAVFIGRLDYHTGIRDYAKSVDLVRKKYPKFQFLVIGEGPDSTLMNKYKFLGPQENANKYLEKVNYAFVSRYLSILEALANKKLVFAVYDNPVKEDYLRMAPFSKFIILSKDSNDIFKKINYFIDNPTQGDKFVNQGYKWIKNQTWESVVNTYLRLWKKK